jgi:flagellar motor switch protein FliM
MEKVLSQSEIDELFQAAQTQAAGDEKIVGETRVVRWDLHQAGTLRQEQLDSISRLHESFARDLTTSVSGYLREKFEVTLAAAEQLAYRDLLARFPSSTYCASLRLLPSGACGILQMDLALVFPVVDLLLGGSGEAPSASREVSEIEEMLIEGVARVICHELDLVWRPQGLEVAFEQRQAAAQLIRLMPTQEKTLTLTFEAGMTRSRGALNIAFPAVVSNSLIRKLARELVSQRPSGLAVHQAGVLQKLLDSTIAMELETPPMSVKLTDLLTMQLGGVLPLRLRIDEPARLRLRGRDCWLARPVQSDANRRAAQLVEAVAQAEEGGSAG